MQFDNTQKSGHLVKYRNKAQLWIFLLVWPWLNICLMTVALHFQELLSFDIFLNAATKIWGCFAAAYVAFYVIEKVLLKLTFARYIERDWLFRPFFVILLFLLFAPVVDVPVEHTAPTAKLIPLILITLEALIYMAVMYILHQQQRYYLSRLRTQEAELQMLKMQSNPHFLFNTLNIIASEVTQDAEKAKEMIFDLSDLLRRTVQLSQQQWVSLEQELHLAELYLLLQQKRFEDRLTFDIDSPEDLNYKKVPSLMLLPVVENAVKYGIAPFAHPGHISIHVALEKKHLVIEVLDTGQPFDTRQVKQGEGLRILNETMRLHFGDEFDVKLLSTNEGASMRIGFPELSSTD